MIPKRLQTLFDAQGYATLRQFSGATGITYGHALRRVQSGDIPATNVAPSGSRAAWRLFEGPITEWFAARTNKKPVTTPAEPLPNFYSDDGNWIPPANR